MDGHRFGLLVLALAAGVAFIAIAGFTTPTGLFTTQAPEDLGISVHVSCGDTIVADTTLDGDLLDCATESGVLIGADDITLDCDGFTIDGVDTSATYGVNVTGRSNVVIRNCVTTDWAAGILLFTTNDSLVEDNSASSNTDTGIILDSGSYNNVVTGNQANSNEADGIDVLASYNTSVTNNTVDSNINGEGIEVSASVNTFVSENIVTSNNIGVSVSNSNNTVTMNYFEFNENYGIYVSSEGNVISDNTLVDTNIGIALDVAEGNSITGNNASFNVYGIYLDSSDNNNITANVANSNANIGIFINEGFNNLLQGNTANYNAVDTQDIGGFILASSSDNTLIDNNAIGNWAAYVTGDFGSGPAENNQVTNFNLGSAVVSFDGESFGINGSSIQPADPSGLDNIGISFFSGNLIESAFLEVNVSYSEAGIDASQESSLILAKYDGSDWFTDAAEFSNSFGVDTVNDIVFVNITDFTGTVVPGNDNVALFALMVEGAEEDSGSGPPSGASRPLQPEIQQQELPQQIAEEPAEEEVAPEQQENLAEISGAAVAAPLSGSFSLMLLLLMALIIISIILYEYYKIKSRKT